MHLYWDKDTMTSGCVNYTRTNSLRAPIRERTPYPPILITILKMRCVFTLRIKCKIAEHVIERIQNNKLVRGNNKKINTLIYLFLFKACFPLFSCFLKHPALPPSLYNTIITL